ncbi:MAG: anti-sigma factor [Bacteroidia bacterium]|nr:anti-sigma factor [Bacteroidia bacterium]
MAEELNKDEIRDSGMLELYVAGTLPEEESQRIHQLVKSDPDLQKEVIEIERALMDVSSSFVQQKPKINTVYQVLNKIEEEISNEKGEGANIIDLLEKKDKKDLRWLQIAAAIALILSFSVNLLFYFRLNDQQSQLSDSQDKLEKIQKSTQVLLSQNKDQKDFIELVNGKSTQKVELKRIAREESNKLSVIYNEDAGKIALSQWSLAELTAQEAYQLWAIYGKEVVSLGVLPKDSKGFVFKTLDRKEAPDAFAISYEPNGESLTPTEVIMISA